MTLASSLAADYAIIDGVETVTFTPQNPTGTAVTTAKALRRVLNKTDWAMAGVTGIAASDTVWHVWDGTLGGAVPKQHDIITDSAAVVWTIITLSKETLGTRWRCVCRKRVS